MQCILVNQKKEERFLPTVFCMNPFFTKFFHRASVKGLSFYYVAVTIRYNLI